MEAEAEAGAAIDWLNKNQSAVVAEVGVGARGVTSVGAVGGN